MRKQIKVKCNKCGKVHITRFHEDGDAHKNCGGLFCQVLED